LHELLGHVQINHVNRDVRLRTHRGHDGRGPGMIPRPGSVIYDPNNASGSAAAAAAAANHEQIGR
jgi:hypothetical protein